MKSERKAIRNQNYSYLIVTYYSLFTIIIGIFSVYYTCFYPMLENFSLAASIVVLSASLVAGGFRFETRARDYRDCYLELQKLESNSTLSDEEKSAEYRSLLTKFPNHSPGDYYDFLVQHIVWEGKNLTSGGSAIRCKPLILINYTIRSILYYSVLLSLIIGPIVFLSIPLIAECPQ